MPSDAADGWESVPAAVQRQSVEARRAGIHSVKNDLEKLHASRRWEVASKLFDLYDWLTGKGRF